MLVLGRKVGERIIVDGGKIVITICDIKGDRVRIGIQADKSIPVHREELQRRIDGALDAPDEPSRWN